MRPYLNLTSRTFRNSSNENNNISGFPIFSPSTFGKQDFNFNLTPSTIRDVSERKNKHHLYKIPPFESLKGVDRKEKIKKKANYELSRKVKNPKLMKIRKNLTDIESMLYSNDNNNSSSNIISDLFLTPLILSNTKYLRRSTCEEFLKSISNPSPNIRKSFLDIKCSLKKLNQTTKDNYEKYLDLKNYRLAKRIMANLRKIFEENLDRSLPINSLQEKIDEILNNMVDNLESLPELLKECMYYRDDKVILLEKFTIITQKILQTHDYFIYIESLKILGKIYKFFGDYNKSLQIYFQASVLATKNELFKSKMKIHKRIGKIYLELQSLYKAKSHFIKGLHLAWFVDSEKYELEFYDFLGVIAYYESDVEKAKFYHEKMLNSEVEPKNSSIKQIAIKKIINKRELRKTKEISFYFNEINVSSEEEEVGLYDMKKDIDKYVPPKKSNKTPITFTERQKVTPSSMFRENSRTVDELQINLQAKLYVKLQKERRLLNLLDRAKNADLGQIFSTVPNQIYENYITTKNQNDNHIKGIYGIEKSITMKDEQKFKNYKIMKAICLKKDKQYVSHLSNNRNLGRFQRIGDNNVYSEKKDSTEIKFNVDRKISDKLKKCLQRFTSNIQIAVSRIEMLKNRRCLSPDNKTRRAALKII